jgi:hypothetical protein
VICFKAQEGTSFDEVTAVLLTALAVPAGEGLKPPERIQQVITGLQQRRCLVLIDNLEVVLHPAQAEQAGYTLVPEWGLLLNALANLPHQSQVILTSREQPQELGDLRFPGAEPDRALVQVETIGGVSPTAGVELLRQRGLRDSEADLRWVADRVQGNAFMLTLLANVAKGKPGYLRKHPELVTQRAEPILRTQLARQSEAGRELLKRMCVLRVPIDLPGLTFLRLYWQDEWVFGRFRRAVKSKKPAKLNNEEILATLELFTELGDRFGIAEINFDLAVLEYKRGHREQAASHYAIAHQQLSQLGAQKDLERIDHEWQALAGG